MKNWPAFVVVVALLAVAAKWGMGWALIAGWLGLIVASAFQGFLQFGRAKWDTSRSQVVYRVLAEEKTGKQRRVWARWGHAWLSKPVSLELKWEE